MSFLRDQDTVSSCAEDDRRRTFETSAGDAQSHQKLQGMFYNCQYTPIE